MSNFPHIKVKSRNKIKYCHKYDNYDIIDGSFIRAENKLEDAMEMLSEAVQMCVDDWHAIRSHEENWDWIIQIKKWLPITKKWYDELLWSKKYPVYMENSKTGERIEVSYKDYYEVYKYDIINEKDVKKLIIEAEDLLEEFNRVFKNDSYAARKQTRRAATTRKRVSNPNIARINRITKNLNKVSKTSLKKFK